MATALRGPVLAELWCRNVIELDLCLRLPYFIAIHLLHRSVVSGEAKLKCVKKMYK